MYLPTMEIYNDDAVPSVECESDSPDRTAWARMLREVSRLEKLKKPNVRLLGTWSPRAALQAAKDRAVNGGRAALLCIDRTTERLIFVWADEGEDNVYRLANLRASGFVLGVMVFNSDKSIACYPEQDEETELKLMLLNFFARMIQNANAENAAADELMKLAGGENFSQQNAEKTLDLYSATSDATPVNIHDEITYVNRTPEVSNV
jgi:hypothetical protein